MIAGSASPSRTLATTWEMLGSHQPTLPFALSLRSVPKAEIWLVLSNILQVYETIGTWGLAVTNRVPWLARSAALWSLPGFIFGVMTARRLLANGTSGPWIEPSFRALFFGAWSAEAKTSADAPCWSWARSWDEAPKLKATGVDF